TVSNAYAGVSLAGNSSLFDTDCEVGPLAGQPTVVGAAVANDIGNGTLQTFGIRALNQANVTVDSCVVRNVTGTSTSVVDGIILANQGAFPLSSGGCRIFSNQVSTIANTSASAGKVSGIRALLSANAASEARIYDNMIWDLQSASASATRRVVGINLQETGLGSGAIFDVDFNSVRIAASKLACSNACLEIV